MSSRSDRPDEVSRDDESPVLTHRSQRTKPDASRGRTDAKGDLLQSRKLEPKRGGGADSAGTEGILPERRGFCRDGGDSAGMTPVDGRLPRARLRAHVSTTTKRPA